MFKKKPKTLCKIFTRQPVVNNGVLTYWHRRDGFARGFHGEASVFRSSFTPPRSARSSCTSHRRSPLSCPPLCGSGAGLRGAAPAPAALTARRTHGECAPRGWKWEVALLRGTEQNRGGRNRSHQSFRKASAPGVNLHISSTILRHHKYFFRIFNLKRAHDHQKPKANLCVKTHSIYTTLIITL